MSLPSTNISLSNIAAMFSPGKAPPFYLSDYYKGGTYVSVTDTNPNNIATSGTLSFGNFRGAQKASAAVDLTSNRATYLDALTGYTNGTNTWTSKDGTPSYTIYNRGTGTTNGNVQFNGSSTYALTAALPGITPGAFITTGLTMIAYYYRNGNPSSATYNDSSALLLNVYRSSTSFWDTYMFFENYVIFSNQAQNDTMLLRPNTTISSTGWQFRAYTVDTTGATCTAYYNGNFDGSKTLATGVLARNGAICIGRNNRDPANYLNGVLKVFYIFTRTLNSSEISQIYSDIRAAYP